MIKTATCPVPACATVCQGGSIRKYALLLDNESSPPIGGLQYHFLTEAPLVYGICRGYGYVGVGAVHDGPVTLTCKRLLPVLGAGPYMGRPYVGHTCQGVLQTARGLMPNVMS